MNTLVVLLLGAGVGGGVYLCIRAILPRPAPIEAVLAGLGRPGRSIVAPPIAPTSLSDHLGQTALRVLEAAGRDPYRSKQELELVERTPERHALDKLIAALAGLLMPNLVAVALTAMGLALPVGLIAILSVATMVAGFVMPDYLLRDEAEKRRRAFRHALSSYLDLVNVLLAGGAGIETALYAAADAGDGWGYQTIRGELRRARLTGRSPWDTFAALAERLGINELAELAASVSLAGSHGARIRASLAAEAATERMTVPVAVLLFGFLVFIAYPAIAQITSVSGPQP